MLHFTGERGRFWDLPSLNQIFQIHLPVDPGETSCFQGRTWNKTMDQRRPGSLVCHAGLMCSGKDAGFGAAEALDPALPSCVTLGKTLPFLSLKVPFTKVRRECLFQRDTVTVKWMHSTCPMKTIYKSRFLPHHHRLLGFKTGAAGLLWKDWAVFPELLQPALLNPSPATDLHSSSPTPPQLS